MLIQMVINCFITLCFGLYIDILAVLWDRQEVTLFEETTRHWKERSDQDSVSVSAGSKGQESFPGKHTPHERPVKRGISR